MTQFTIDPASFPRNPKNRGGVSPSPKGGGLVPFLNKLRIITLALIVITAVLFVLYIILKIIFWLF